MAWIEVIKGLNQGLTFELIPGEEILIGRQASTCQVVLKDDTVSRIHVRIMTKSNEEVLVSDGGSTNGTIVNGKTITQQLGLYDGDVIILGNTELKYTKSVSGNLQSNISRKDRAQAPSPYPYFQRSPRFIPEMPSGEVEINPPPNGQNKPQISWVTVLLPPIAMAIMFIIMALAMKGSPTYLYITLGMTMVTVSISVYTYYSQVKEFKAKEEKRSNMYQTYIRGIREDLNKEKEQQHQVTNEMHPSIEECFRRVIELDRKIWDRTPLDSDFLSVRVGKGSEPFQVRIKIPKQDLLLDEDPLKEEPKKVLADFTNVDDVPVCVTLAANETLGLVGERNTLLQLARAISIQLATHHCYDEVKLIYLFSPQETAGWEWARWLPHVWDDARKIRFMAADRNTAHSMLAQLYDQIKLRESESLESSYREVRQLPHLIFFIAEGSMVENEPIMRYLTENNHNLGITTVFLVGRLEQLPKHCQAIIEATSKTTQLYHRNNAFNKTTFTMDDVSQSQADRFARVLAPVRIRELAAGETLPERVDFLDSFGAVNVDDLNIKERWLKNKPYRSLSIPIGKKAGGDELLLDMHQNGHGPHGLVAGTVGSGKSEILQSIILALAVQFHPHYVAFVLIDYKGGAMARSFYGVPHLVGTITNLGGNETNRALVSIKSEIRRRQRIFDEHGLSDIDTYQRHFREGKASIPLPHLFMIADEFAELKAEQPDFMKEVISAARVGRSLGIHLILATQKPSGVVDDQIWSNSRFKLCLKVLEPADSKEMIKRPDAAGIQFPGRCYILVGHNEYFDQFQSSWSGAEYSPSGLTVSAKDVHIVNLNGTRRKHGAADDQTAAFNIEKLTQMKAVIRSICELGEKENIEKMPDLWLPPLSERMFLSEIINDEAGWDGESWRESNTWVNPIVGMLDDPANQIQKPLAIDLGREGHLLVYGAPGTGKTTFLQTMMTSLALNHNPNDVHLYILDFGGRTMNIFTGLPHLGGVVFDDEEEKLLKLFKMIRKELETRKRGFADIGVASLPAYKQATGEMIPAIIIAVDNYPAVIELYGDAEDIFVLLSREGGNYGIHLIITANSPNAVRFKLSQNIKCSIALQMTDKADYVGIVGRTEGLEPANAPGRGLIKGKPPLEFQTALPVHAEHEADMALNMRKLFTEMDNRWPGRKAKAIPIMPEIFSAQDLLANDAVLDMMEASSWMLPIGLDSEDMEPVGFDLLKTVAFVVSGQFRSGKSSFLKTVTSLCSQRFSPAKVEIYIIDSQGAGLSGLSKHMLVKNYISDASQTDSFLGGVIEELNMRKRAVNAARRDAAETFDEAGYICANYPIIMIMIDNLGDFMEKVDNDSKDSIERIVRYGKGLGICLLLTGLADDISKYMQIDSLTRAMVDLQAGLLLGGCYEQHNMFILNMPYQERNRPLYQGEGYLVQQGKYARIKLAYE